VTDMRNWAKRWNDAAVRRIAERYERPQPSRWPLFGMLALGLVAGAALGGYAVSQRRRLQGLSAYARRIGDLRTAMGMHEGDEGATIVNVPRSKLRRKATSEV
jgi:hypothetical protein